MMGPRCLRYALCCLALLSFGAFGAIAANTEATEGKALLEQNCGRCHSLDATGASPLPQAPPLREVYLPSTSWSRASPKAWGPSTSTCRRFNSRRIESRRSSTTSATSPASIPLRGRAPLFPARRRLKSGVTSPVISVRYTDYGSARRRNDRRSNSDIGRSSRDERAQ